LVGALVATRYRDVIRYRQPRVMWPVGARG
jgi:hypothetical protein